MTMELVVCMSGLKPRKLSMLRGFYQTQHPSSKTVLVKEENGAHARSPGQNPLTGERPHSRATARGFWLYS